MHFPTFLVSITISSCIAGVISYFAALNFWVILGVIVAAMFIVGMVAEIEDKAPGGINNPSDKDAK